MLKSGRKTPDFNISKVVFCYVYLYAVNTIYSFVWCKRGGSGVEVRRGRVQKMTQPIKGVGGRAWLMWGQRSGSAEGSCGEKVRA